MKYLMTTLLLAAAAASIPAQAAATLTLLPPSGNLFGSPGNTVGWGFTITNNMNYLLVTSANFCLDNTTDCFNPSANFTDYISGNRVVVGPPPESPVVSQNFSVSPQRGIGAYTIPANDPIGDVVNGLVVLTYDLFTRSPNDPNFNPDTDLISNDNFLSQAGSVTTVAAVPEPATLGLMGLALAGFGAARLRRRK
jgi:hypothetical protein